MKNRRLILLAVATLLLAYISYQLSSSLTGLSIFLGFLSLLISIWLIFSLLYGIFEEFLEWFHKSKKD